MVRKAKPYRQTIGNSGTAKPEAVGPSGSMLVRIPDSLCVRIIAKKGYNSMKKRLLSKVLAVLVAFSLTVPAFAEYVAAVTSDGAEFSIDNLDAISESQKFTQEQFENEDYYDFLANNAGSTLHILSSIQMDHTVYVNGTNTIVDLHENTLTISGATEDGALAFDCQEGSTVQNGRVVLAAPDEEWTEEMPDGPDGVIKAGIGDLHIKNLEVKTDDDVAVRSALSTGYGEITVEDSIIYVEGVPVFGMNHPNGASEKVTGNAISGVFYGSLENEEIQGITTGTEYVKADGKQPSVITSKDTAAVVQDADGKYHLYDNLAEASKAVGEGVTVNVIKGTAPEGFEIKDGVLSKVEKPVGPVTPIEPIEPVTPILPVFPEVMDIASAPASSGTTAIEDEAVPLAGLTPLGELISYLYTREGSPDGEDAEGEYTLAMAWAIAKEIVAEDADPEEIVTGSILRDVMTAYAELLDTTFDVEIKADDDAPVMNCGEILADFFEAREAKTK